MPCYACGVFSQSGEERERERDHVGAFVFIICPGWGVVFVYWPAQHLWVLLYWPTLLKTVPWFTVNPVVEWRSGDAPGHDLFYESPQANSATDATPEATHRRVRYQGLTVVAAFQGRTCQLGAKQEIRHRPSNDETAALPAPCRSQLPLEHR